MTVKEYLENLGIPSGEVVSVCDAVKSRTTELIILSYEGDLFRVMDMNKNVLYKKIIQ